MKHLTRGGVLGRFVSHSYMRRGRPRAEDEFRRLAQAVSLGIRVPKPILYAVKGGMVYRCWIATKEVSSAITLADLSTKDEDLARTATADAATEIAKLITHSIYHIDLHPGNVIVDSAGRVYLMDFDKTRKFRGNINQLRDSYICRWRRAVIKHGLPEYLSEIMSLNLRRDFFEASLAE
ncbi:MAG: hypothetical protein D6808_03150 [Candidatus Dadabacteria bacterium]|nr:MAG: hypothetical protein D6808_03150 [Candidatus Dadabacteria bacterium]